MSLGVDQHLHPTRCPHPLRGSDLQCVERTVTNARFENVQTRNHAVNMQEEEAAETAVKGAKQAGRKPRKSKRAAKKASRTAASSHADNAQEAAAAEQPANQHAAPWLPVMMRCTSRSCCPSQMPT